MNSSTVSALVAEKRSGLSPTAPSAGMMDATSMGHSVSALVKVTLTGKMALGLRPFKENSSVPVLRGMVWGRKEKGG